MPRDKDDKSSKPARPADPSTISSQELRDRLRKAAAELRQLADYDQSQSARLIDMAERLEKLADSEKH